MSREPLCTVTPKSSYVVSSTSNWLFLQYLSIMRETRFKILLSHLQVRSIFDFTGYLPHRRKREPLQVEDQYIRKLAQFSLYPCLGVLFTLFAFVLIFRIKLIFFEIVSNAFFKSRVHC